jgi:hypothetical protein
MYKPTTLGPPAYELLRVSSRGSNSNEHSKGTSRTVAGWNGQPSSTHSPSGTIAGTKQARTFQGRIPSSVHTRFEVDVDIALYGLRCTTRQGRSRWTFCSTGSAKFGFSIWLDSSRRDDPIQGLVHPTSLGARSIVWSAPGCAIAAGDRVAR